MCSRFAILLLFVAVFDITPAALAYDGQQDGPVRGVVDWMDAPSMERWSVVDFDGMDSARQATGSNPQWQGFGIA